MEKYTSILEKVENLYLRDRTCDLKDVGLRIFDILLGTKKNSIPESKEPYIVLTKYLSPSETAKINKGKVAGFAVETGGETSHAAIIALSLGIPLVLGVTGLTDQVKNDDIVIIDGYEGFVIINPSESLLDKYQQKQRELARYNTKLLRFKNKDSITMDNKPVTIRTIDIGGDKKLPSLAIEHEVNPFLGYRGLRLCLDHKDIFKTQLRAILKASIYGNLKNVSNGREFGGFAGDKEYISGRKTETS